MRDPQLPDLPFIQARQFRRGHMRAITHVVLHDAECSESKGAARAVASYFASLTRPASAHYVIDDREIICCVLPTDVAFAAPPINDTGLHIELCGYAKQTAADWADTYSAAQLELAAELVAELCDRYQIPPVFVDAAGLVRAERGITTHAQVSRAWRKTDHVDPGASFPIAAFCDRVRSLMLVP